MYLHYCWLKTFYCLFCFYCTEETFFFLSWHQQVQILELMPNDEKSIWLIGRDSQGDVQIGFIVSFSLLLHALTVPKNVFLLHVIEIIFVKKYSFSSSWCLCTLIFLIT